MDTTDLYRPVGEEEMAAVRASGWRAFPARPEPGIFYAVVDEERALRKLREWHERDGGAGYVVGFAVQSAYLAGIPVDDPAEAEYWIPEDRLKEFNAQIVGLIWVAAEMGVR